ncbi:hypothetical protein ABIA94_006053 [Bradyrhizobium sp. LA7.1]
MSFPATLIGSNEPWKSVDVIKGFHWLNYEGGKFSTSRNRGIFTDQALEELPADLWRWWLVANAPESADTDFNVARFVADVNKDLADIFGNLVNRIVSFAHRAFDGRIPEGGAPDEAEHLLARGAAYRDAATPPRGARVSCRGRRNACDLGCGERLPAACRAVDGHQVRSASRGDRDANSPQSGPHLRRAGVEYRAQPVGKCAARLRWRRCRATLAPWPNCGPARRRRRHSDRADRSTGRKNLSRKSKPSGGAVRALMSFHFGGKRRYAIRRIHSSKDTSWTSCPRK